MVGEEPAQGLPDAEGATGDPDANSGSAAESPRSASPSSPSSQGRREPRKKTAVEAVEEKACEIEREAQKKGLRVPVLSDPHGGNVRSRTNAVLLPVFMIASSILTLTFFAFTISKRRGLDITFESPPPPSAFVGIPMKNFSVRVRQRQDYSPVARAVVTAHALSTQLITIETRSPQLNQVLGTLAVRTVDCALLLSAAPGPDTHVDQQLCNVSLSGNVAETDASGVALFKDLTITTSHPGSIQLLFAVSGHDAYGSHILRVDSPISAGAPPEVALGIDDAAWREWERNRGEQTCDPTAPRVCYRSYPLGSRPLPVRVRWILNPADDMWVPMMLAHMKYFPEDGFPASWNVSSEDAQWLLASGIAPMAPTRAYAMALAISQVHSATQSLGAMLSGVDGRSAHIRDNAVWALPRILPAGELYFGIDCGGCPVLEARWNVSVESWNAVSHYFGFHALGSTGMLDVPSVDGEAAVLPTSNFQEIVITPEIQEIEVLERPNGTAVEEGIALPPAVFRILGRDGLPLANKRVYARIVGSGGFPRGLAMQRDNRTDPDIGPKQLLHSVSHPSGPDGIVTFSRLAFSVRGPVGTYAVSFGAENFVAGCRGRRRRWGDHRCPLWQGNVTSSVAEARAFWDRRPTVYLGQPWETLPSILVADAAGSPVAGKSLALSVVPDSGRVGVNYEVHPSGSDGWISLRTVNVTAYSGARQLSSVELTAVFSVDGVARASYALVMEMDAVAGAVTHNVPRFVPEAPPAEVYPCRIEEECGPLRYATCQEKALRVADSEDQHKQRCRCEMVRTMCEARTAAAPDVGRPGVGSDPQPGCATQRVLGGCLQRTVSMGCGGAGEGIYCENALPTVSGTEACDPLVFDQCSSRDDLCRERALFDALHSAQGGQTFDASEYGAALCGCSNAFYVCAGPDGAACVGRLLRRAICLEVYSAEEQLFVQTGVYAQCPVPWCSDISRGSRGASTLDAAPFGDSFEAADIARRVSRMRNSSWERGRCASTASQATPAPSPSRVSPLVARGPGFRREGKALQEGAGAPANESEPSGGQGRVGCAHVELESYPAEVVVGLRLATPVVARAVSAYGDVLRGVPLRLEVSSNPETGEGAMVSLGSDVLCEEATQGARCRSMAGCEWLVLAPGMARCVDADVPEPAGSLRSVGPVVSDEWGVSIFRRFRVSAAAGDTMAHFVVRAGTPDVWGHYSCTSVPVAVRVRARLDAFTFNTDPAVAGDSLVVGHATDADGQPLSGVRFSPVLLGLQAEVALYHPDPMRVFISVPKMTSRTGLWRCRGDVASLDICFARVVGTPEDLSDAGALSFLLTMYPGTYIFGGLAEGVYAIGQRGWISAPLITPPGEVVERLEVDERINPGCHHIPANAVDCARAGCQWDVIEQECTLAQGKPFPRAPRVRLWGPDGRPVRNIVVYAGLEVVPEADLNTGSAERGVRARSVSTVELWSLALEQQPSAAPLREALSALRSAQSEGGRLFSFLSDVVQGAALVARVITPERSKGYFRKPVPADYSARREKRFTASEPSDADGWATFTDLGFVGAYPGVYRLVFRFMVPARQEMPVFTISRYLLYVAPPGLQLTISQQPSSLASPGVPFATSPVVRLVDPRQAEHEMTTLYVKATVNVVRTEAAQSTRNGAHLGDWALATAHASRGEATLTGLAFSRGSLPGHYALTFHVPGASSVQSEQIEVTQRAGAMELVNAPALVPVGASFGVRLFVGIANRAALPGVQVTATLHRDDSRNCISDSCGVLEQSTAQGITDNEGYASLRLRILAASPGRYTVTLAAGAGVSAVMRRARGEAGVVLEQTAGLDPTVQAAAVQLVTSPQSLALYGDIAAAAGSGDMVSQLPTLAASFSTAAASNEAAVQMAEEMVRQVSGGSAQTFTQTETVQLEVTNVVRNVTILRQPSIAGSPTLSPGGPVRTLDVAPSIQVTGSDGRPLEGKSVTAVALPESAGARLQYSTVTLTNEAGIVILDPFRFAGGSAGVYTLVFLVDGVASAESAYLQFSEPAQVTASERLAQRLLLTLAFMLPIFRANWTQSHPAYAAFGLLCVISYTIVFMYEYRSDLDETVFNNPDGANKYILTYLIVVGILGVLLFFSVTKLLYTAALSSDRQGGWSRERAEGSLRYVRYMLHLRVPLHERGLKHRRGILDLLKCRADTDPHNPPREIKHVWFPVRFLIGIATAAVMDGIAMGLLWSLKDKALLRAERWQNAVPDAPALSEAGQSEFNGAVTSTLTTSIAALSSMNKATFGGLDGFLPSIREMDWHQLWVDVVEWTRDMVDVLRGASTAATVLTIFTQVVCLMRLIVVTKGNMMNIRRGKQEAGAQLLGVTAAVHAELFVGMQALLAMAGFFLCWFLVFLVFLILLWEPLRRLALQQIYLYIATMLATTLFKMFVEMVIVRRLWSSARTVTHPRYYLLWALPTLFLNFVSGAMLSAKRVGMALGSVCLLLPLTDICLFPALKFMDYGWVSYWSVLYCENDTNNPCAKVFAALLVLGYRRRLREQGTPYEPARRPYAGDLAWPSQLGLILEILEPEPPPPAPNQTAPIEMVEQKRGDGDPGAGAGRRRIQQRLWLWWVLTANPSLRAVRKHRLMVTEERVEEIAPTLAVLAAAAAAAALRWCPQPPRAQTPDLAVAPLGARRSSRVSLTV